VAAGTLTTQMISLGGMRAEDARVPARRCVAGGDRERSWVGVAAWFLGDPYGDVVTPAWFVHVWHGKRDIRHSRQPKQAALNLQPSADALSDRQVLG
jgi:hypothetical protein